MYLHSTMVLLKQQRVPQIFNKKNYLHSTMVLLKLYTQLLCFLQCIHLHSTMVLLKHMPIILRDTKRNTFTFHYGSSQTMFKETLDLQAVLFTFHYGSSQTQYETRCWYTSYRFTFHYGSSQTISLCQKLIDVYRIYIPLWFFSNGITSNRLVIRLKFTFHYGSSQTVLPQTGS